MKKLICAITLSVFLFSCKKKELVTTYIPRLITANESFNQYPKTEGSALTIYKYGNEKNEGAPLADEKVWYNVKIADTTISIQTDPSDAGSVSNKFARIIFVNTQKTCLLAQIADNSGLTAPFYLIALKEDGKLEIVQLYRPSKGVQNKNLMGMTKVGRAGYLINNDFFISNVNAKAYLIKRQNPQERIQGRFFVLSPDRQTLVFLMPSRSLYQVNYTSGETLDQPLNLKAEAPHTSIYSFVQNNFSWEKNKKGISFLKPNDDDPIIDISEF